jgi:hypothetical protein
VSDDRRYVLINLPHTRIIVDRIGRSLDNLGGFTEGGNGASSDLGAAYEELEATVREHEQDLPPHLAIPAADAVAERGRTLVAAILRTRCRGDRLGQCVRNLFECLGLSEEGAALGLECGERPDSPLR